MLHALLLVCRQSERDFVAAELYGLDTLGITEGDLPAEMCELEAFFAERFDERAFFSSYSPQWREHADDAGSEWVDTFEPFAVGERLYIVPAWRDDPIPSGRLRLAVHVRQASGSGYQPATQLALMALERHLQPADRFLDVGTGSGILSVGAELLGSGPRFACDIDLDALAEARENGTPAHLFGGTPRSIAPGSIDLVVANLNAEALLSLQGELVRVLAPGGRLILSGFTARSLERLTNAFGAHLLETPESGEWRALVFVTDDSTRSPKIASFY